MGMYGNFAVWATGEKQPIWADGAESTLLTRVSPSVRLKVLRREAAHYLVRLPDMRQGYVSVDAVAAAPMSPASDMLRREAPKHTGVQGEFVRASYFTRIMAKVVDSFLFWIAIVALGALAGLGGEGEPAGAAASGGSAGVHLGTTFIWGSLIAIWGIGFLYEWIGTAAGGTIGKSMLKLSVIDESSGRAPGLMLSFRRYASQTVLNVVASIGWLWSLDGGQWALAGGFVALYFAPYVWAFIDNGKTWYDRIAGTWVVQYR